MLYLGDGVVGGIGNSLTSTVKHKPVSLEVESNNEI